MVPTLHTPRLILRSLSLRDAFLQWRTFRIPHFLDGLDEKAPPSLWKALRRVFHQTGYRFSIRQGKHVIGALWIVRRDPGMSLGYWLHPSAQHQGFMREAVAAILMWADTKEITPLYAQSHHWNARSAAILEMSGFSAYKETVDRRIWKRNAFDMGKES